MEGRAVGSAISRCVRFFRSNNLFTSTVDFYKIPVGHGNHNNYTIPVSCGHGDTSNEYFFYPGPNDYHGHGNINDNIIYTIPVRCRHDGNINVPGLKPFHKAKYIPLTSTIASVGSSLFSVGGDDKCTRWSVSKIYRLDRACAPVWEDDFAVTMLCSRVGHHVVGMDGKLYTMGGLIDENYSPWGECFDPSLNKLSRLPSPPFDQLPKWGGDSVVVAPLHSSKKILVAPRFPSSSDVAFFYRVEDEAWEELDHMVDFSTIQGEAAVLRNSTTLCWFRSNTMEIHAYDLVLRKWFKSPVEGLDKVGIVGDKGKYFCWFRLDDNRICLLWQDLLGLPINRAFGLLHCAEVEVKISECSPGEFILKAFVVFSQSYVLEPGARLFEGLALLRNDEDYMQQFQIVKDKISVCTQLARSTLERVMMAVLKQFRVERELAAAVVVALLEGLLKLRYIGKRERVEVLSSRYICGLVWYLGQVYKAFVLETELKGALRGLEAIRANFAYRAGRDMCSASNSSCSNMFWTIQI